MTILDDDHWVIELRDARFIQWPPEITIREEGEDFLAA